MAVATTTLSSKGQVVIPEDIREKLGLRAGMRFVVIGEGDAVVLKILETPDMTEFDNLLKKAREAAQQVGLAESDVQAAITKARRGE